MATFGRANSSITLRFEVEGSDDPYGALLNVKASVFRAGIAKQIGTIAGIRIDRQKIADNCFWETFDEDSADLEWVGSTLLENRYGRTKLASLREAGDDPEFFFFFIDQFWIDAAQPGDVAALALRKFLESEHIKGKLNNGHWYVSSVAYVLSKHPQEDEDVQVEGGNKRKRGEESEDYHEIIPFLRNGFYQDPALIRGDNANANARIVVAAYTHLEEGMLSESEALAKASRMTLGSSQTKKVKGNDLEILNVVKDLVTRNFEQTMFRGVSSAMLGLTSYQRPPDCTSDEQLRSLKQQLLQLRSAGGSIARSGALHAACEKNSTAVVRLLLQLDPDSCHAKDHLDRTPLIVAAISARGRLSINGIDDTAVIDALVQAGADKAAVDSTKRTAYGHFREGSGRWLSMTRYEHRHTITNVEHKLYPPGGPTVGDFAEGKGGGSGLVDYGPEDDEADREMGRGKYASNSDCDY